MTILVTGGAGYIGSIVTEELVNSGNHVVVLDNLSQGHQAAVVPEAVFIKGDLCDQEILHNTLQKYGVDVVMHLAADKSVENSMIEPGKFFWNNVACGINLLDCMVKNGVMSMVFSSSAAVYGQPKEIPITEDVPLDPVNAYGESKLIFERILRWYGEIHGLKSISLRYFNVAGASKRFGSDCRPETNLIPIIMKVALGQQKHLSVFGDDYDTEDGTCVRDYIHVLDIAKAHILALDHLGADASITAYNLGNGDGYSVLEVVEEARRVTGTTIPIDFCPRRPGDPPKLVASSDLAKKNLGWRHEYPRLEQIINSAWLWHKEHPTGYDY